MTDAPAPATESDSDAARRARLDALFARRVEPLLPEFAAMQAKYRGLTVAALVGSVLLTLLFLSFELVGEASLGVLAVCVAAGALAHYSRVYRDRLREALTPIVCEAIGGMDHRTGSAQEVVERLRRIPLVNRFGENTVDDVFAGRHDGTEFLMAEVRLFNRVTRRSSKSTTTSEKTVFRGLVFLVATPRPVEPRIVIRGPAWWFGHRWRRTDKQLRSEGYARVAVPDAAFSRHLTLWSDAGEAALEVVGPELAATLARLAATAGRKRIDAAFMGSRFILLLPKGGNSFSAGGLFRPLSGLREETHRLMDEVMVVHRLIDVLKGAPATPA